MKKGYLWIAIFILFDQATKYLAKGLYDGSEVTWIPQLLAFSYAENTGMSFGLLEGQRLLFMIVTIIALGIFGYLFLDINFKTKKIYSWSIVLLIAGTLGNAIDRVVLGYVIDFMHFPFLDNPLQWVGLSNFYNNFADMYLTLAMIFLFIDILFLERKRTHHEND